MEGIADIITGFLDTTGFTEETSVAVQRALVSPTYQNITAVEDAFAAAGTSASPELMQTLWERSAQATRDNPLWAGGSMLSGLSSILPWILAGGVAWLLFKNAKGR